MLAFWNWPNPQMCFQPRLETRLRFFYNRTMSQSLPRPPSRLAVAWRHSLGSPRPWFAAVLLLATFRLPAPVRASGNARFAVATEAPRATKEAQRILEKGGNAVDAAITAALVSGLVSPSSSGLGGGTFIHYWNSKQGQSMILDARETAPKATVGEDFEGRPFPTQERGKWVGVPGELAGLWELHRRYGSMPWGSLVDPAVGAAERGFEVSLHLGRALRGAEKELRQDQGLVRQWLSRGRPQSGARVNNPLLAITLRRIAQHGPQGFYEGPVAADMVQTARAAGGWLSHEDLTTYTVKERKPLKVRFGDYDIYTMPPPSAGGLMLAQAAQVFTPAELRALGFNTPAYQHALAESFRASLADRFRFLGDPDVEAVDINKLLDPKRLASRRARISLEHTHRIERFGQEEFGTHHLVVADPGGDFVTLTTTVNRAFGAKLLARNSGILLNDELDDFSKNAWMKAYGGGLSPNRARPSARPLSSMTPTFAVRDGRVALALGGSGGMNIATDVSQMALGHLVFGLAPDELLRAPRFQVPMGGQTIAVTGGATVEHINDLTARGELVATIEFTSAAVQMIAVPDGAHLLPAADPRKFGLAVVGEMP
jgi:gamma-glutamyltranspeptidase/glutathione hydrolase